jgi:hypothetical protein
MSYSTEWLIESINRCRRTQWFMVKV